MAMNRWILDVGNTRAKWACFAKHAATSSEPTMLESVPAHHVTEAEVWKRQLQPQDLVMVTGSGNLTPWVESFPNAWVLQPGDATPLPSEVRKRETLGLDRVANAWAVLQGACSEADPHEPWLIVDAGTCLTMDVVHAGMHLGGTISPGIRMRLEAMAQGTARLPLEDPDEGRLAMRDPGVVGEETAEALLGGALGGVSAEIHGKWHALRQEVPNLGVIVTGGDAPNLELRDIRPKFADAHLTLKGYHALFTHAHPHL